MEQQELYRYYSTQRPVDIGTYPKDPDNPLTGFLNYDEVRRCHRTGSLQFCIK